MESLFEILQSTSDALFPAELGKRTITVDSCDCEGDTPLHVIVRRKNQPAVEQLLSAGANPNARGDMGETPLHIAIRGGSIEIVAALVRHGARAGIRTEFGETALDMAIKHGGEIARLVKRSGT